MGKDWISKAIRKPGQLRRDLKVPDGKPIPAKTLATAARRDDKIGQRARMAQTLKKLGRKKG